eukprot:951073-Ditylum_brightwellii.AAC.1
MKQATCSSIFIQYSFVLKLSKTCMTTPYSVKDTGSRVIHGELCADECDAKTWGKTKELIQEGMLICIL